MIEDLYKTIQSPSNETLFKDKNSKFYGYAFPVENDKAIKLHLEEIRKKHPSAGHHCYAYQLGVDAIQYRVNDDGEPNNSAGMPIYGQIQSFNLTNVLLISVRYFGGTKLGVGGLINAYKTSAKLTLEASTIVEKVIQEKFELQFTYDLMNKVMRIIKEKNLDILHQKLELDCKLVVSVRRKKANEIFKLFKSVYQLNIKRLEL